MSRVAIVGAGMSRFGARPEGAKELFAEAFARAASTVDRNFEARLVQEAYVGSMSFGGSQIGNPASLWVEHVGLRGVPARRVENACASSGFALRDAYLAVRSGEIDVALVGGVEKMNDLPPIHQRYWLGASGDTPWERLAGLTFSGVYALLASRHMHEFGTKPESLAAVAVKNHAHGARNENAQFQKAITMEQALSSPFVAEPLRLFDCCSTTDGAAVVLVASEAKAREFTDTPVWIEGAGAATDHIAVHDRPSLTRLDATVAASREAYRRAGVRPQELDLAEVHDCFTIAEILATEDLGLCAKGQGGSFALEKRGDYGGDLVVNPSGGLKAKGHPLGATGAAQAVEAFLQLRGRAGKRQVPDAETALCHNVGGSGATCAVHVLGV
ncbi:MAG TPA: thiolase domain-containing protein [Candidatus Thermoplasmatota archaeon]|nr:thiolase domain-containing protein [Candidatus Thermoplasmatota archaeon]